MDDRAVKQLVDTLEEPAVRSLVLVPAESPASATCAATAATAGWSSWTAAAGSRTTSRPSSPTWPGWRPRPRHLRPRPAQRRPGARDDPGPRARRSPRVLQVLVSEHRRSRPRAGWRPSSSATTRTAPRRIDVVLPPRPRACRSAALWSAHRPRHRRPRLTTGKPAVPGRPTPANLGVLPDRPPAKPVAVLHGAAGVRRGRVRACPA